MAQLSSSLPNCSNWSFQQVEVNQPDRAAALEAAGPPDALVESLGIALKQAITRPNDLRLGRDHLHSNWSHVRGVVQFRIGPSLFDWFFNARTGYRAHFRAHYKCGLKFNNRVIQALLPILDAELAESADGRETGHGFTDCGGAKIPKNFLLSSLTLERFVTKIWYCTERIGRCGGIEHLPVAVVGEPRLILEDQKSWPTIRSDGEAWLDVKGGFLGKVRPYQSKNPFRRARELHGSGTA